MAPMFAYYITIHLDVLYNDLIRQSVWCPEDVYIGDLMIRVVNDNPLLTDGNVSFLQQSCFMVEMFDCQKMVLCLSLKALNCNLVILQIGDNLAWV